MNTFNPATAQDIDTSTQGVTPVLDGFNPATSAEIPEDVVEEEVVEPLPTGNLLSGVTEPLQSVAADLGGMVVGGLAGHVAALTGDADDAAEAVTSVRDAASEFGRPQTQRGMQGLENLGELMELGLDAVNFPLSGLAGLADLIVGKDPEQAAEVVKNIQEKGIVKATADSVLELTDSPLLAAAAETAPAVYGSIFPLYSMGKIKNVGSEGGIVNRIANIPEPVTGTMKMLGERKALHQKYAEDIIAGGDDGVLAKYVVDGAGKLKSDPIATEAIKQGYEVGAIAAIKGSSAIDKGKMSEMLEIHKRGTQNRLYKDEHRPADVAGDSLAERIKYVRDINREAGSQLDGVAKSLKGQYADYQTPVSNFILSLDEMGISIGKGARPNFNGSIIDGKLHVKSQRAITDMLKQLVTTARGGRVPDAYDMHRLKQSIDETVNYGGKMEGLTGKVEGLFKTLRREIDSSLDNAFPEYNDINTAYAETISALNGMQDAAGSRMNFFGDNADKALGTLMRRLTSNVQSRVNLSDAIRDLEATAKQYGGTFDDSLRVQMLFANELDSMFGAPASTSFKGEIAGAIKQADKQAGRTVFGTAVDIGAAAAEKARGINDENAIKIMEQLLQQRGQDGS